jgi:TonB family protein
MSLTNDSEMSGVVRGAAGTPVAAKPTAVEIPVTVNGARTAEGSEKREPFSETTQTVLVFGQGAIIRLGSHVAPGQLLFLTNEKSKKEVVCQVVRSKHGGGGNDYVELKFTEPAPEFWGIRFGSAPLSAAPLGAAKPAVPAPVGSLEQKLAELNAVPAAAPPRPPEAPEAKPRVFEPQQAAEGKVAAESSSQPQLPTLSEFLAHGASGPELKAREKAKPTPPSSTVALKEQPADKAGAPGLSSVLLPQPSPAPGATPFDFAVDEVKIPAWLEPLARNATVPVPAETEVFDFDSLPVEAVPAAELPAEQVADQPAEEKHQAASAFSAEGATPNFGSSLALDARTKAERGPGGSFRIGWKLALLVAGLLLAAAVGWYWYTTQPAHVSASSNPPPYASAKAPETAPVSRETSSPLNSQGSFEAPAAAIRESSLKPIEKNTLEAANSSALRSAASSPVRSVPEAESAPEPKKPALGKVRLSAPVVKGGAAQQVPASEDPGLALGGVSGGDDNSLSLLGSKSKQPAAPVPVGGDVKPAKLVSSIPPIYPQLARTQRLSGDVTIDALIEANGRVSSTKVLSGPALLHQAAVDAVKQWKYQAATLNGQPTAMHLTVVVQFKLQ